MHRMLRIFTVSIALLIITAGISSAQIPSDCEISPDTLAGIRQMLTAPDNGIFFDIWTREEIACACIHLYYNDPPDANYHDRVIAGAVVLLGKTEDPRAVPVLIDAIDTHGPQALYALGNFPTVEALLALKEYIGDEDPELRDNAAEGLRRMPAPGKIPTGWKDALKSAINEIESWLPNEDEPTLREYFQDALKNLKTLLTKANKPLTLSN